MADSTINIDLLINTAKSAKSLKEQREALKDLRDGLEKVKYGSGAFELLSEEVTNLTKEMGLLNLTFEDAYGEIKPLTSSIGELEDRLYQMALAGQQNTDEFKQIQVEVVRLKKELRDVDDTIDAMVQRGAKLQGFINIAQAITGSFAVAKSGLKVFGVESKAVETSLEKTATVIELLSGLEAINNAIKEKNVAVTLIQNGMRKLTIALAGEQAVAEAAQAAATGSATIAQRALNAAMAANPIGIVITAVIALTSALILFGDSSETAAEKQERLTKANEEAIDSSERWAKTWETAQATVSRDSRLATESRILDIDAEIAKLEEKTKLTKAENDKLIDLQEEKAQKEKAILKTQYDEERSNLSNRKDIIDQRIQQIRRETAALDAGAEDYTTKYNALLNELNDLSLEGVDIRTQLEQNGNAQRGALYKEYANNVKEIEINLATWKRQNDKKWQDEAIKAQQDYVNKQIELLNDLFNRNKNASDELRQLKAEEIKDLKAKELELQAIRFDKQKEGLIDKAIERELKSNEDKFKKLLIDQKTFEKNRTDIQTNGVKFLTQSEQDLYNFYIKQNDDRNKAITTRFEDQSKLTVAEQKKLAAERELIEFEYSQKTQEFADKEIETNNKITASKQKSLEESIANNEKDLAAIQKLVDEKDKAIAKQKEYNKALTTPEDIQAGEDAINLIIEKNKANDEALVLKKQELEANKKLLEESKALNDQDVKAKEEAEAKKLEATKISTSKELELRKNLLNAEIALLDEKYKQDISNESLTTEQKAKITEQYLLDMANLKKNFVTQELSGLKQVEDLVKKSGDDVKNWYEKLTEDQRALFDGTVQFVNQMSKLTADVIARDAETSISHIERLKEVRLQAFDEAQTIADMQWNDAETKDYIELNRKNEIAAQRAAIEEEYNVKIRDEKRRAFNAQKAASIIEIGINTAVAVSKVLANPILAALVGIAGAAQATFVATQPTPEFALGGILDGPSHSQGGIKTAYGELEGGEAVINKKSTKKYMPLLSAINEAGGGVKFAGGGVTPNAPLPVMTDNSSELTEIKSMLKDFASKPILTYVNESEVTRAQRNQQKIDRRTTF